VIEEAVATYRRFADIQPDAFLPGLARSLNNLSNRLSQLGRPDEALAASEDRPAIYRGLVETRPDDLSVPRARKGWACRPAILFSMERVRGTKPKLAKS
jgi:hypothetical protein